MSRNDGEAYALIFVVMLIGIVLYFIFIALMAFGLFAYLASAFAALVLTPLCWLAWDKPLRIGSATIEPAGARHFVWRGAICAALLPAFLLFVELFAGFDIAWRYWHHFVIAGYAFGTFLLPILTKGDLPEPPPLIIFCEELPAPPPPPPALPAARPREIEPFRYASWDDEEPRP